MVGFTFEGPAYADRVGGKLTFRDWDHWTEEDKNEWRDDPRAPRRGFRPQDILGLKEG